MVDKPQVSLTDYVQEYLEGVVSVILRLNKSEIEATVEQLIELKKREGRLFLLGVGGGAANSSHAVNDFRKIAGIEAYTPVDNVAELSARTNDDGWDTVFVNWLKGSRLTKDDGIMVYSVGGGNLEKNVSANIVKALKYAKEMNTTILGIVGRDGGYTKQVADACILIPVINDATITPYTEAFQAVIWHALVNYPGLKE